LPNSPEQDNSDVEGEAVASKNRRNLSARLLVIFFIALLVFGPKKLPEPGKGIGAGIRALKDGVTDPNANRGESASTERQRTRAVVLIHIPEFSDVPILCARDGNRVKHVYGMARLHRDRFGINVKDFLYCLRTEDIFLWPFRDYKPSLKKNEPSYVARHEVEVMRGDDNGLSFAREGLA
jgi:sec-independent protein translocase protein TatA